MLAPSTDIRASNSLETVQNQYQIQGLELDFTIVAWDADLRREKNGWAAFKLSGSDWQRDKLIDVAKNGYRVILTRARQGMVIFVRRGIRRVRMKREMLFSTMGLLRILWNAERCRSD